MLLLWFIFFEMESRAGVEIGVNLVQGFAEKWQRARPVNMQDELRDQVENHRNRQCSD